MARPHLCKTWSLYDNLVPLISISIAINQAPAYTARPRIRGQCIAWCVYTTAIAGTPVPTYGCTRMNWPGWLTMYQDGELINNTALAAHHQTVCHYRLVGPVMTLILKTFSAVNTYMTDTWHKGNSAFHPSGVGKWVLALAGKAKAGMVHSVSRWMRGVQVKLWDPLRTCAIHECLRGVFKTRRYTNQRLPWLQRYHIIIMWNRCWWTAS